MKGELNSIKYVAKFSSAIKIITKTSAIGEREMEAKE
jgi:hypothetical protein